MKYINKIFKFIITVLAICGACYLFSEIVDRINSENPEEENEGEACFFCRVRNAAQKQMARIK